MKAPLKIEAYGMHGYGMDGHMDGIHGHGHQVNKAQVPNEEHGKHVWHAHTHDIKCTKAKGLAHVHGGLGHPQKSTKASGGPPKERCNLKTSLSLSLFPSLLGKLATFPSLSYLACMEPSLFKKLNDTYKKPLRPYEVSKASLQPNFPSQLIPIGPLQRFNHSLVEPSLRPLTCGDHLIWSLSSPRLSSPHFLPIFPFYFPLILSLPYFNYLPTLPPPSPMLKNQNRNHTNSFGHFF